MRLINIRLLTNQYRTMFYFYKEKLGEVYLSLFSQEEMMKALNYNEIA